MANWDKIQSSGDVEDRRGNQVLTGLGSLGTIIAIGAALLFGGDTAQIQSIINQLVQSQSTSQGEFVDTKNYKAFAQKVIGSNNEIWKKELDKQNINYIDPKLVLFRGATNSECGGANSQVGPHYCPVDKTIYLDETFFEELTTRFGAKGGDVAEAYVMAHEVGHHVQKLKGAFSKVDTSDNANSIKIELQADCYAGVWAGDITSEGIINENEIDQAIDAAGAVGDDRIQKASTGRVNPETWTHGSSAQRKQWFLTGYKSKDSTSCNTIS
ncbi:MAG: neutral zinc metallopeptidase [candidate division SR1 bacterium]|nr:neutral zinc metallopeptidase [candidate division SR1 bacterium]